MSKDNVKQMFGKMEKDVALKNKYAELMKAHMKNVENELAEKLIEFGKTSGFAFSKDDLLAARTEILDKANSNQELSEGDLAGVAGGQLTQKECMVTMSICSFGLACAMASIFNESFASGTCGRGMSTIGEC